MIVNKQMGNYLVQPKHIEESKSEEIQYYVRDYRDFNFDEVKEKTSKMNLKMVKINANDYIEGVANNLYKNIDMWDLILLINGREALNDMPYDNDRLDSMVSELVNNYFYNSERPFQGPLSGELIEAYKQALIEKMTDVNYKNMVFKVIDPNDMGDFLRDIKYK